MIRPPILWGVTLACALGGALAGNALGSTPVSDRDPSVPAFYQSHETYTASAHEGRAPPDHYPLTTRNGVVPVEQLSDRGLFRQARYRPLHAVAVYAAAYVDDDPGQGFDEGGDAAELETSAAGAAPSASEPPDLARGPLQSAGQARFIDVQATLAVR